MGKLNASLFLHLKMSQIGQIRFLSYLVFGLCTSGLSQWYSTMDFSCITQRNGLVCGRLILFNELCLHFFTNPREAWVTYNEQNCFSYYFWVLSIFIMNWYLKFRPRLSHLSLSDKANTRIWLVYPLIR